MFDLIERSARFVCLPYGSYVVGVAIRQSEFFPVPDKPFAELFIFPEFFEQGYILRIRAQAVFEHVFGLGEPYVDAKVGDNIPARIMPIGTVLVFGDFGNDASVDERGIGIVVFGIGGISLAVLEPFLGGLQFLCKPADAVAVTDIVVFHIADEAFVGMHAVDGGLFAAPLFLLLRHGNSYFHKFLFPNGEISVKANRTFLPGIDFQIPLVDLVHDVFRNGFNVFFCHGYHLNSSTFPKISSNRASASVS